MGCGMKKPYIAAINKTGVYHSRTRIPHKEQEWETIFQTYISGIYRLWTTWFWAWLPHMIREGMIPGPGALSRSP